MSILTVYFDIDQRYASIKEGSKMLQFMSDSVVLVRCGKNSYEGRVIGRSGILVFYELAAAMVMFFFPLSLSRSHTSSFPLWILQTPCHVPPFLSCSSLLVMFHTPFSCSSSVMFPFLFLTLLPPVLSCYVPLPHTNKR
jgi:hypothetical protein